MYAHFKMMIGGGGTFIDVCWPCQILVSIIHKVCLYFMAAIYLHMAFHPLSFFLLINSLGQLAP